MTIDWEDEQLEEAGIDKRKLESIVRRLTKIAQELESMNLRVMVAGAAYITPIPPAEEIPIDYSTQVIAQIPNTIWWDGGDPW